MSDWQLIETAPKDGNDVLLFGFYLYPGDRSITPYWSIGSWSTEPNSEVGGWEDDEGVHPAGYFTHWMPLTKPQIDTEKNQVNPAISSDTN